MRALSITIAMVALALFACSGDSNPTPAPAEPTVPFERAALPGFKTILVAELGFSIDLPELWEVEVQDEETNAALIRDLGAIAEGTSIESQVGEVQFVFDAAPPPNLTHSVTITVERLVREVDADTLNRSQAAAMLEISSEFKVVRQEVVDIGGRDAGLTHSRTPLSVFIAGQPGQVEQVSLIVPDGRRGWTVSCGGIAPLIARVIEECEVIVRTFRLLS